MRITIRVFPVFCAMAFCLMVAGEEPTPAPDVKPTEMENKTPLRTKSCVEWALEYLTKHQEADGHFDTKKYQPNDQNDTVATSLMLLAFLGTGSSEKVGQYKQNVLNSVAWLIAHQAADGSFTDPTDATNPKIIFPTQALATMALGEAAGMANIPETKIAAQKAIDFCLTQQEIIDGKRYGWAFTQITQRFACYHLVHIT